MNDSGSFAASSTSLRDRSCRLPKSLLARIPRRWPLLELLGVWTGRHLARPPSPTTGSSPREGSEALVGRTARDPRTHGICSWPPGSRRGRAPSTQETGSRKDLSPLPASAAGQKCPAVLLPSLRVQSGRWPDLFAEHKGKWPTVEPVAGGDRRGEDARRTCAPLHRLALPDGWAARRTEQTAGCAVHLDTTAIVAAVWHVRAWKVAGLDIEARGFAGPRVSAICAVATAMERERHSSAACCATRPLQAYLDAANELVPTRNQSLATQVWAAGQRNLLAW